MVSWKTPLIEGRDREVKSPESEPITLKRGSSAPPGGWSFRPHGRVDKGLFVKAQKPVFDRPDQGVVISAGKIGSADGAGKQGIPGKKHPFCVKTDPSP